MATRSSVLWTDLWVACFAGYTAPHALILAKYVDAAWRAVKGTWTHPVRDEWLPFIKPRKMAGVVLFAVLATLFVASLGSALSRMANPHLSLWTAGACVAALFSGFHARRSGSN